MLVASWYICQHPQIKLKMIRNPGIDCLILDIAGCTSGFADLEGVIGQSVRSNLLENFQYLYPDITFTCNGSITSWSVLVRREADSDLYPDLQLWREESEGIYTKVGNTTLSGDSMNQDDDIYEYPLDSPLEFQAGDIFGIFQPPGDHSHLRVRTHRRMRNSTSPAALRIHVRGSLEPPYDKMVLAELDTRVVGNRAHILISVSTGECNQ